MDVQEADMGVLVPSHLVEGVDADSFRLIEDEENEGRYLMDFCRRDAESGCVEVVSRVRVTPSLLVAVGAHIGQAGSADLSALVSRNAPRAAG